MTGRLLPRSLFAGPADYVALNLLGAKVSAPNGVTLRLTEVEAYAGPLDPASHAFRRTARSEVMFGEPGHLYVYFIYGMHWCANIVTGPVGVGSAVLLRAAEVIAGHDVARTIRGDRRDHELARGPASITALLGLTAADTGADLCRPGRPFAIRSGIQPEHVSTGPRVGLSVAAEVPWRFWDADAASVSAYRRGGVLRRSAGRGRSET